MVCLNPVYFTITVYKNIVEHLAFEVVEIIEVEVSALSICIGAVRIPVLLPKAWISHQIQALVPVRKDVTAHILLVNVRVGLSLRAYVPLEIRDGLVAGHRPINA